MRNAEFVMRNCGRMFRGLYIQVSGGRCQVRGKVSIKRTFSAPGVGRGTSDSFSVAGGGVARL